MEKRIGFIGLGVMGKPMAKNLRKAGYSLRVYDIAGKGRKDFSAILTTLEEIIGVKVRFEA